MSRKISKRKAAVARVRSSEHALPRPSCFREAVEEELGSR